MKAEVVRIIDGDTIEVKVTVRLNRVDTPETRGKEKALGLISKQYTTSKLTGKDVQLAVLGTDYYDRVLAEVYLDGENFNDMLVKDGKAEIYSPANHNNGKVD
jgi:micrococcal nuclease